MRIKEQLKRISPGGWIAILTVVLLIELVIAGMIYIDTKLDTIGFEEDATADAWRGGDRLNVLLLGTDERAPDGGLADFGSQLQENARADACMLLSLDMKKHTAQLVSLERAIGVPIEGVGEDWLTHVFTYGGADAMLSTIREQFGVEVYRYVRVNVGVAAELIDAIGGVDITLTETEAAALNGEIYSNSRTKAHVTPGLNHLDGFDAIAYARQRFIDSDFHRVQRQRNVLQAALDQTKELNLKELDHLLDVALPKVQTNFTKGEVTSLILKAPSFFGVELQQMTLPLKGMYGKKYTDDGRSLMMLDQQETTRILTEFFNGDFDPETYVASDAVQARVWQAQQQAMAEWNSKHPPAPPVDHGQSASEETQAESSTDAQVTEEDGDTERSDVMYWPPRD
ncbi:MAG: LCP family protein [Candidatus Fimivivens sp.]